MGQRPFSSHLLLLPLVSFYLSQLASSRRGKILLPNFVPGVIRSPEAVADVIEIWSYIAEDNPSAADSVMDRFDRLLQKLARQPEIGRAATELAAGLRIFTTGSHLIFYRPIGSDIEIVRVLHGARDITAEFFRD